MPSESSGGSGRRDENHSEPAFGIIQISRIDNCSGATWAVCFYVHGPICILDTTMTRRCKKAGPKNTSGSGAPEVAVTAEMIKAGRLALAEFHSDFESEASAVERIYRAMESAKCQSE